MAVKLITPEVRGWFVHLDKPQKMKGEPDSEPRYQVLAPLSKKDRFWRKFDKAIEDVAKEKWGKVPAKLKRPKKDGDEEADDYEDLEGMFFFNASNTRKPGVVDKNLDDIIDPEELYSGAWYVLSINLWAWEHATGGKGVSVSLNNVMKVKDDKRLDGVASASSDFAAVAEQYEDDDDDYDDDDDILD